MVIVAGGLGLAPLRPAIYHVLANRSRYGRVVILYGCRNPGDMLYRRELEQWRQRLDVELRSRSIMRTRAGAAMSGWCRS